jgi:hypothetical protein
VEVEGAGRVRKRAAGIDAGVFEIDAEDAEELLACYDFLDGPRC